MLHQDAVFVEAKAILTLLYIQNCAVENIVCSVRGVLPTYLSPKLANSQSKPIAVPQELLSAVAWPMSSRLAEAIYTAILSGTITCYTIYKVLNCRGGNIEMLFHSKTFLF